MPAAHVISVSLYYSLRSQAMRLSTVRTAVPFWGQSSLILGSLSPKRDRGSQGVKLRLLLFIKARLWVLKNMYRPPQNILLRRGSCKPTEPSVKINPPKPVKKDG